MKLIYNLIALDYYSFESFNYLCSYIKIGRLVFVSGYIVVSAVNGQSGTSTIVLPFAVEGGVQYRAAGQVELSAVEFTADYIVIRPQESTSAAYFKKVVDNVGVADLDASAFSATDTITFSAVYIATD